ncbi:MAG TPA: glycosyltransferase family 39 protein [Polyangiaceae bacterium]|nr:glycosyltransferase family 39 protein [Polyangiaceae bacterium]
MGFATPAVVALGALLRALHLLALSRSPLFDLLQWDAGSYDRWAREIAGGKFIGSGAFWQDPLYAYVLGFSYRVFGYHLVVPRVLALACGLVTIVCTARIAERVWQTRGATLAAALFASCYLPEIHYEGIVGKTALSVCLLAGALDAFMRPPPGLSRPPHVRRWSRGSARNPRARRPGSRSTAETTVPAPWRKT